MLSFTSVFGGESSGEVVQMPGSEVGGVVQRAVAWTAVMSK
jgi:hypothetical protein